MAAAGLSEVLKPNRFDVNPITPGAIKLFKHWLKSLENFKNQLQLMLEHKKLKNQTDLKCFALMSALAFTS